MRPRLALVALLTLAHGGAEACVAPNTTSVFFDKLPSSAMQEAVVARVEVVGLIKEKPGSELKRFFGFEDDRSPAFALLRVVEAIRSTEAGRTFRVDRGHPNLCGGSTVFGSDSIGRTGYVAGEFTIDKDGKDVFEGMWISYGPKGFMRLRRSS